jgi:hypothetical protein
MTDNKTLLTKADVVVADLASGGLLTTAQSTAFIRKLLVQPTILPQTRVVVMNSPKEEINKIQFASRIMRPAVEATALSAGDRSKPDLSKLTLTTKETMAEVRIPYSVIEDNIERGGVADVVPSGPGSIGGGIKDTIMTLIAERAALDLEELAILGDTASGDTYLAQHDGYLKLATSNVNDALNSVISKTVFKDAIKTMPDQYLRDVANLVHYLSFDNETEYRDITADRQTNHGDSTLQGNRNLQVYGTGLQRASLMPADKMLFTNKKNLLYGIQRQIQIETDKDIRTREYIIVLTVRVAFEIEEVDAVVKTINLVQP